MADARDTTIRDAKRAAVFAAIAAGERRLRAVAVTGGRGHAVPPCGACLQVLAEFSGTELIVLLAPLDAPDRGTTPLLRDQAGTLRPVDWHTAMTEFCGRMKDIQARHGPHSIAFLGTGQICTEEMALLGCLFKFGMGCVGCAIARGETIREAAEAHGIPLAELLKALGIKE